MRLARPYNYLGTVQGLCRECRTMVPARILAVEGAVFQERICAKCGKSRVRIADQVSWYHQRMTATVACKPARLPGGVPTAGCPRDCGPCRFHANACHLPIFSVTNVCNLACPICFTYNRSDRPYFMTRAELRSLLDRLLARTGPQDLVNITGGEPSLHPDILALLAECQRPEIGRVTMNSNGLRLAADEDFCRALADLGVYVILSLHTLNPARSQLIHGQDLVKTKLQALENLHRFEIGVTLLNVMIRGVNEFELDEIFALARTQANVRSITVQTMTYTGKGGKSFSPREPMPLDGAALAIERATRGTIPAAAFFPHAGAHPLCYSVAYFLKDQQRYHSFTRFFSLAELRQMLGAGYLLQPTEANRELFRSAIDRLWANGDPDGLLPVFKRLVNLLYPAGQALSTAQRQALVEENILTIYIHAHMDEDTFDLARLVVCPDQVPDPEGRLIPACAYNLFYRQKDPRFWAGETGT